MKKLIKIRKNKNITIKNSNFESKPTMTIKSKDVCADYWSDGSGSFTLPKVINEAHGSEYHVENGRINDHISYIKEYMRDLENKYNKEIASCRNALIVMEEAQQRLKVYKNELKRNKSFK